MSPTDFSFRERAIQIPLGHVLLEGDLSVPDPARGLVIFAHGSGSSRHSPRNRQVARVLRGLGLATVLLDLLSPDEAVRDELTAELRFDVSLLARRLLAATEWTDQAGLSLPIGYFGASTGAAAALIAAAERPKNVRAVVSRGGRPDLAADALHRVTAATLLIVGARDPRVLDLNRHALDELASDEKELEIIPGATHLFEEPGALDDVAHIAGAWFDRYLPEPRTRKNSSGVRAEN